MKKLSLLLIAVMVFALALAACAPAAPATQAPAAVEPTKAPVVEAPKGDILIGNLQDESGGMKALSSALTFAATLAD